VVPWEALDGLRPYSVRSHSTGDCWGKAHSNDAKTRAKLKRKRVQP